MRRTAAGGVRGILPVGLGAMTLCLATLFVQDAGAEGDSSDTIVPLARTAPEYPFHGLAVVASGLSNAPQPEGNPRTERVSVLQYWDSQNETYHEVLLGEDWSCTPPSVAFDDRIDIYPVWEYEAAFSVPWGDFAYPLYAYEPIPKERLVNRQAHWVDIDVVPVVGAQTGLWLKMATSSEIAWYEYGHPNGHGLGLEAQDAVAPQVDEERLSQWEMYGSDGWMHFYGTDGRHYGFGYIGNVEASCLYDERAYVIDGASGAVITCGHAIGGLLFVNGASDPLAGPAWSLPKSLDPTTLCGKGLDLRKIQDAERCMPHP